MGLLTKLNTATIKSTVSDLLTGSTQGKIEDIRWGMLGNFVFSAYTWPYDFNQENEDEYVNYPNLAGYVARKKLYRKNTKITFSFDMVQRDVNEDTQNEQQVFEEDIIGSLNYLHQQKNSGTPLELVLNNGELSLGFFSINKIIMGVTEFDPNGRFFRSTQTIELEQYAPEQIVRLKGDVWRYKDGQKDTTTSTEKPINPYTPQELNI